MVSGLESAKRKLDRAAQHIKEINPYVVAYAASILHEVVTEPQGEETVHVRDAPPPEISMLAGETLYQIRSALDHLAFDLVKFNPSGYALPADWEDDCCFPLWLRTPKKTPVYNCFEHILPGISKAAFTFIEGAQPYNSGNVSKLPDVLWFLAKLSNIDKHRHFNLTQPQIGHIQTVRMKWGGAHITYRALRSGAKLEPALPPERMADAVNVETRFSSYVTFAESALGAGADILAVQVVLESCLDLVQGCVIPAFAEFLKNP